MPLFLYNFSPFLSLPFFLSYLPFFLHFFITFLPFSLLVSFSHTSLFIKYPLSTFTLSPFLSLSLLYQLSFFLLSLHLKQNILFLSFTLSPFSSFSLSHFISFSLSTFAFPSFYPFLPFFSTSSLPISPAFQAREKKFWKRKEEKTFFEGQIRLSKKY
jgi:hypothetical protein